MMKLAPMKYLALLLFTLCLSAGVAHAMRWTAGDGCNIDDCRSGGWVCTNPCGFLGIAWGTTLEQWAPWL